jgi:symplekin
MENQAVRSRYLGLSRAPPSAAYASAAAPGIDDDDEYEPDFEPEDAEQVVNRLDGLSSTDDVSVPAAPLAPFKLPEVSRLSQQEAEEYGIMAVHRLFELLVSSEEKEKSKTTKGFNRLAASDFGRDAWATIISRLATRATTGLDVPDDEFKDEFVENQPKGSLAISQAVREGLLEYVMKDWKKRLDVGISWLNEEWYHETILAKSAKVTAKTHNINGNAASTVIQPPKGNYQIWALRLLDRIIPIVEYTDKIILRFFSELPALDHEFLSRIKKMAEDPERIDLACMVLQYLYMFRPPVKKLVVDVLAELWRENDRAKPSARKLLLKWNPVVLQEEANGAAGTGSEVKKESAGGGGMLGKESANGALEIAPL